MLWTCIRNVLDRKSARIPDILIEDFRSFPHAFYACSGIVLRLGHDRFLPIPFETFSHPTIRRCIYSLDNGKVDKQLTRK
jgi:hypothetical protein